MKIEMPVSCPSCGGKLELVNAQLFCRNSENCPAQSSKLLENFCKKMKLKGFGPATIEKLGLVRIPEIYFLSLEQLHNAVGVKTGDKLYKELEDKLHSEIDFGQFLGSLGIPLVGEVAARKLAVSFNNLEDVKAEGKAGENLKAWKNSLVGKEIMEVPWKFGKTSANAMAPSSQSLGISVCITGSLSDFKNRTEAGAYLESLGLTVKKDVTKDVRYLICEDESKRSSSSYLKAIEKNIPIVTINDLKQILQENN